MAIDLEGDCIRCRTCDGFPCKLGAKGDAETRGVDPALATGNARLITGYRVLHIATDYTGRNVTHLIAEGPSGQVQIRGRKFVLAAGAVNSAALLLASAGGKHPSGLANSTGLVGRNFMMHNNTHLAAVDLNRTNDVTFQKTLSVNDWYLDGGDGVPLGTLQLIGKVQGVMMRSYATKVPTPLLNKMASRSVEWLVMSEDLPSLDNRVTIGPFGTIGTAREAIGLETHERLLKKAKALLREVGYDVVFTQPFDISMNSHQCGTLVAGTDPATSVLDPWCRAHELDNLWVVDSSFFPSSAAMNPALTIAAQALRVAAEDSALTA